MQELEVSVVISAASVNSPVSGRGFGDQLASFLARSLLVAHA